MSSVANRTEVQERLVELGVSFRKRESLAKLEAKLEEALEDEVLDFDDDDLEDDETVDLHPGEEDEEDEDLLEELGEEYITQAIKDSPCFSVAFYDPEDGSTCPEKDCILRLQCRKLADEDRLKAQIEDEFDDEVFGVEENETVKDVRRLLLGKNKKRRSKAPKKKRIRSGVNRKRHVHSELTLGHNNGGYLCRDLKEALESDGFEFIPKSEYFNVVRDGDPDKKDSRVLRAWPKIRALHVYVPADLVPMLKVHLFDVITLSKNRRRFFTPHVGYVTIKNNDKLKSFLDAFRNSSYYSQTQENDE